MTFEEYKKLKRERVAIRSGLKRHRKAYHDARRELDRLRAALLAVNDKITRAEGGAE